MHGVPGSATVDAQPLMAVPLQHFLLGLVFLIVGGLTAAVHAIGVSRLAIVFAIGHVTLAVFGGVLMTVIGALFQLGPMFTQHTETAVDRTIQRIETVIYPIGVVGLAGGRLTATATIATVGGLLVALGLVLTGIFLGRCLYGSTVQGTPMLSRYWVVVASMLL